MRIFLVFLLSVILFTACSNSKKPDHADTVKKIVETNSNTNSSISAENQDSIDLILLVKKLYKWRETVKMKHDGFKPLKSNPSDTLYTSIDLDENKEAIEELSKPGFLQTAS